METAAAILTFAEWWGWIGFAVAVPFLIFGIDRVDENARGAYVARPLFLPAVILIWPLVLWRWAVLEMGADEWAKRHRPPRRSHGLAALAFALAIPAVILLGLAIKQTSPIDAAPQLLAPPAQ
ncbi:MAG: hypothetical protein AAGF90_07715 [Pseudomonadota bacterium]